MLTINKIMSRKISRKKSKSRTPNKSPKKRKMRWKARIKEKFANPTTGYVKVSAENGMLGLVARRDIPIHTEIACYPVELRKDCADRKIVYCLDILKPSGKSYKNIAGDISEKSMRYNTRGGLPCVAMLVNEPGPGQIENSEIKYPVVKKDDAIIGRVVLAKLKTIRNIKKCETISTCYGASYDRDYKVSSRCLT